MLRLRLILYVLMATSLSNPAQAWFFSEDPFQGLAGTFVFNEFMQLDNVSPQHLHTGIDIGATTGAAVYPPIPAGKTIKIQAIGSDYVFAQGTEAQGGDIPCFEVIHLTPNGNLQVGQTIGSTTTLGTLTSMRRKLRGLCQSRRDPCEDLLCQVVTGEA